ncbi:far upstream element-binding protein 2-like [Olea europaea var. sylvestris]|uniref:far upstream element-binding protein 2-like n=1 Tax=Olea europaea var. sylvestris TaxID=158386 RepID=UPI000C1D6D70|nr:far upstream element-binding protein 2-like [Olea europaea var. sylvestris]
MAEEVMTSLSASPMATPDHNKRKHEELELNNTPEQPTESDLNAKSELGTLEVENGGDDESEAKRPRLEMETSNGNEPDGDENATQNKCQEDDKVEEPKEEESMQPKAVTNNAQSEEESLLPAAEASQELPKEDLETVTSEQVASDGNEKPENRIVQEQEESRGEIQEPSVEVLREGEVLIVDQQPGSESQVLSQKMEVPNDKVGVLIGKAGDTIRSLQDNSGAKIQIVRDADADPRSISRPVELIGTLENITKAEKLIKDVIAEADAGGSPSLVARGFNTVQAAAGGEQLEIQVPNEKVGLIIGKGGETIKNLQTRSGARIQLIPQHLPEGDQSKDRTVRVTGNKKQIEMASEMMKEVMNQTVRPSSHSGGYSQQAFRPRGPASSQWGSRGPHHSQFSRYDLQRGPFPSQNPQYPTPSYGNYPPQQAPRSSFGPSWEQRPQVAMQAPSPQANYNYGQSQGPDYGQPTPYSQAPAQQYGHGYSEVKYDHQASAQHYRQMASQPTVYAQGGTHPGYAPQDQYGKAPTYGMLQRGPQAPSYVQPRPNQPGDMPYQAPVSSTQAYGQNVPPQQSYPYASSGPMQQNYPPYGSVPSADGYNHPPPATASSAGYPQQAAQPVAGYGQPGGQQASAYPQTGPTGGYPYQSSQPAYNEQPAANNAYGYQAPADPAYGSAHAPSAYAAPTTGQLGYGQPAPTQPGYDQSIPQPAGAYGSVPAASPQPVYPQYDATQTYGAHR